jgi:hypothetical protein
MRRILVVLLGLFMAVAIPTGVASAQSPHYVRGPTFSLSDNTVTATGSVGGLGNENIDVRLSVNASATVDCRNPGGNIAPGQTKFFTVTNTQSNLEPKNGRVNFTISATAEPSAADLSGACPNPSWTPLPRDVTVQSATLNIIQPAGSGNVVLSNTQTF